MLAENTSDVLPENNLPPEEKPPKRFPKLIIILIILLVLAVVGGSSVSAYQYYFVWKPIKVLVAAYEKIFPPYSFRSVLISNQKKNHFELKTNYHQKLGELSEVLFSLDQINGNLEEKVSLHLLFSKDDLYFNAVYIPDYKVYAPVNQNYPELLPTKTYQLVFPIMMGTHWLHVHIPTDVPLIQKTLNIPTVGKEHDLQEAESSDQTISGLFEQAIIIRGVNRRFVSGGRRFYKFVVGFKKDKLLDWVNSLRYLDTTIDDFYIESLVQVVESVENWDYDVMEILIDYQSKEFHEISLNLSSVPNETVREILKNANKRYFYFVDLSDVILKMFEGEPLGRIKFTDFNQASQVRLPDKEKVVEFETIYQAADQENLLPLLRRLVNVESF